MSEPASLSSFPEPEAPRAAPRSRTALLKRLADVVCLPTSRINAFERSMTADLLVEMLRDANVGERERVARRLATLVEIPGVLARLLMRDELPVARALLVEAERLSDADLIACLYQSTTDHRRLIAKRRGVSEVVADALIDMGEGAVIETLLRNAETAMYKAKNPRKSVKSSVSTRTHATSQRAAASSTPSERITA